MSRLCCKPTLTVGHKICIMETGKRLIEYIYPRRVKRRLVFNEGPKASLEGFEAMWKTDSDSDLTKAGVLFASDAFVQKEYTQIFDLIKERFEENGTKDNILRGNALVRGFSGVGKLDLPSIPSFVNQERR